MEVLLEARRAFGGSPIHITRPFHPRRIPFEVSQSQFSDRSRLSELGATIYATRKVTASQTKLAHQSQHICYNRMHFQHTIQYSLLVCNDRAECVLSSGVFCTVLSSKGWSSIIIEHLGVATTCVGGQGIALCKWKFISPVLSSNLGSK